MVSYVRKKPHSYNRQNYGYICKAIFRHEPCKCVDNGLQISSRACLSHLKNTAGDPAVTRAGARGVTLHIQSAVEIECFC